MKNHVLNGLAFLWIIALILMDMPLAGACIAIVAFMINVLCLALKHENEEDNDPIMPEMTEYRFTTFEHK